MDKKSIFIICQYKRAQNTFRRGTLELLSAARELKEQGINEFNTDYQICAVVLDCGLDTDFYPLFKFGADKVIYLKHKRFETYDLKYFTCALVKLIKEKTPDIVLFSATNHGRELAPGVTSKLNTGLTADCTSLELQMSKGEIKLAATRPTFGGVLMATIFCKTNPQCATVREGVLKTKEIDCPYGEVEEYFLEEEFCSQSRVKIVEFIPKPANNDLEGAKVIFAGGKGLKTKENFEKLRKLCAILNVSLGASRGAVDLGIAPQSCQIGQTGKTVSPEIYVAFGISGAIHHMCAMSASRIVAAVNNDPNAPIFSHCDYKIVTDANTLIDEMLKKLS